MAAAALVTLTTADSVDEVARQDPSGCGDTANLDPGDKGSISDLEIVGAGRLVSVDVGCPSQSVTPSGASVSADASTQV